MIVTTTTDKPERKNLRGPKKMTKLFSFEPQACANESAFKAAYDLAHFTFIGHRKSADASDEVYGARVIPSMLSK